ncbi:MAG: SH3 domain-containing protein [Desulfovibrio sp.]|nr:SH3 domain-containing protein [Desulfovibrio sp.]
MPTRNTLFRAALLCCLVLVTACGTRYSRAPEKIPLAPWMNTPEDVRGFPQDLNVYAKAAGWDKRLMSAVEQAASDAVFNRIFFGPWEMSVPSARAKDVAAAFHKARGYKSDGTPWRQEEWARMERDARMGAFPSRREHAVTLRGTNLRELPTHEPRYAKPTSEPKADPFDYFQYSFLPPGTPLFIAHTTPDGRWHYVECPVAGGWVDAQDAAPVDAAFKQAYLTGRYAAIMRDNVRLSTVQAGIGAVFPVKPGTGSNGFTVLYPVLGEDFMAVVGEAALNPRDAELKPLPFTPGNVARVGNAVMSQHYGWGGMFGNRDCSSLTRDILTPFSIWLPRNSAAQSRRGLVRPLEEMSPEEKEAYILVNGTPFASLVGARGHIMLYVGKYKGRAAVFHNVWGVRVVEGADDDARFVIGRAVVTSISPGLELKNLYLKTTLGERLRTLTILMGKNS